MNAGDFITMYDIVIIGAGPAGATLARMVSHKYRVLLVDKRILNGPPRSSADTKMCGGLLAPDAQKMLASLGLGVPRDILTGPQIFTVRAMDLEHRLERYYQRAYINIDRERFDRWLVSLTCTSVDLHSGTRFLSHEREGGCFKVQLLRNGKRYQVSTKVLVGADGAFSLLRRAAFPDIPAPRRYLAIQEWFVNEGEMPYYSAFFDRDVTDFYSWMIPKDVFLIIGSALVPGKDSLARFDMLKEKLTCQGFRIGKSICRMGGYLVRPSSASHICTGRDSIAFVGEAAGFISPSSAEGISYAMKSAMLLADALNEDLDNFSELYRTGSWLLTADIMMKNLKAGVMYTPVLRRIVMKSGLKSMDIRGF
jgi:flavin-dependent dehydrogenase